MCVFLLFMGLYNWVFPSTSILEFEFANLDGFFIMAPWVLMFLIPAITMRSFSDEIKAGTMELLTTKPLTDIQIILGKYFAATLLVTFTIIPTFLYFLAVHQLSYPVGNIDAGALWGSYFGLIFLGAVFVSIGIFASSLTGNQIVSFIIAVFLCFVFFYVFDELSAFSFVKGKMSLFIERLGINAHYISISRGVVDTRDVIYFLSLIVFFIYLTKTSIGKRKW